MLNIEKYGLQIAEMVRGYVKDSFDALSKRIDALQLEKGEKGDKGEDGKSVTLDEVKPIIEDFLKSIPLPKNGEDGKSVTIEDVLPKIEEYVKAIPVIHGKDAVIDYALLTKEVRDDIVLDENFVKSVSALLPVPKDGKDVDNEKVDKKLSDLFIAHEKNSYDLIQSLVETKLKEIPIPKNGEDGKSVTLEEVKPIILNAVKSAVDEIPLPKNGENGKDAEIDYENLTKSVAESLQSSEYLVKSIVDAIPKPENGKDGLDGKSITLDDVKPMVDDFLKSIPLPQNGKDGENGKDGQSVSIEQVKEIVENVTTKWQLEFERRAYDILEKAVDKFPKPVKGDKGEDGFGIDSFQQIDARTVKAVYKRGDEVIEQTFKFPAVIDKGVYVKGTHHEQGDGVTFGGSYWIAQKDTDKAPMDGDDWRLAVKRGKDGKDLTKA